MPEDHKGSAEADGEMVSLFTPVPRDPNGGGPLGTDQVGTDQVGTDQVGTDLLDVVGPAASGGSGEAAMRRITLTWVSAGVAGLLLAGVVVTLHSAGTAPGSGPPPALSLPSGQPAPRNAGQPLSVTSPTAGVTASATATATTPASSSTTARPAVRSTTGPSVSSPATSPASSLPTSSAAGSLGASPGGVGESSGPTSSPGPPPATTHQVTVAAQADSVPGVTVLAGQLVSVRASGTAVSGYEGAADCLGMNQFDPDGNRSVVGGATCQRKLSADRRPAFRPDRCTGGPHRHRAVVPRGSPRQLHRHVDRHGQVRLQRLGP